MNRTPGNTNTTSSSRSTAPNQDRLCPWCGKEETEFFQRGYTGPTDESDQFYRCHACGKVTYELVSRTSRQTRLGRYRTGGIYKDHVHGTQYRISRMLKVGFDEYLLHLKPIVSDGETDT